MRALLSFCLAAGLASSATPAYNRLYVFGDSYSDTGAGYVDGDGPTAVAYLAERLHAPLLSARDAKATATSSLNFAVSGARTGNGKGADRGGGAILGVGMENQIEDFLARLRDKRVQFDARTTLFYLAGGLNDRPLETSETARNLENRIRALYQAGGRHFEIAILPVEIPAFREVALRHNVGIVKIPKEMKGELKGIDIRLSQWGKFFDEVMLHPAKYGIENTTDRCAGRALFNEDATPCKNPAAYYYYHAGHPSTAVHKVVGAMLYEELKR